MPISSGAEGHVGVGVDTSIKWIPEGSKEYESLRNSNSYLQRHLQQHALDGDIKQEKGAEIHFNKRQSSTERLHNLQNKQEERLATDNTKQSRNKQSNADFNVHKKKNSSMEPAQEVSNTFPSTTEANEKNFASTNVPAKKSSACAIL